jgi:hypothetical protein
MRKNTFAFIRNKFFLTGLISGVVITGVIGLLVISPYFPPPEENQLKGTMSAVGYTPSVGDTGTVVSSGVLSYCQNQPMVCYVSFDDSNCGPIACHPEVTGAREINARVVITGMVMKDFCDNGGVFVTVE